MEEVLCISAQWSLTAELCCHGAGFCCFSGGRRFSFVPRVRCSAAWKLAVLVASAPSAQLPGPAPKNQSGCPCKEHRPSNSPWGWTRCWSLFWQAVTSSDPPPSLTRGLFPSPAPFRDMVPERRCSGAGMCLPASSLMAFKAGLCFFVPGPALSSALPSDSPSLWASPRAPQAEDIHPLTAFSAAFFVSVLERLENPLQLFNVLKGCLVQCILCNISAFLVSVGHIPWHSESEFLQEKRMHRCAVTGVCINWDLTTGCCELLSALSFQDKQRVSLLFSFWYSIFHSSARFACSWRLVGWPRGHAALSVIAACVYRSECGAGLC